MRGWLCFTDAVSPVRITHTGWSIAMADVQIWILSWKARSPGNNWTLPGEDSEITERIILLLLAYSCIFKDLWKPHLKALCSKISHKAPSWFSDGPLYGNLPKTGLRNLGPPKTSHQAPRWLRLFQNPILWMMKLKYGKAKSLHFCFPKSA